MIFDIIYEYKIFKKKALRKKWKVYIGDFKEYNMINEKKDYIYKIIATIIVKKKNNITIEKQKAYTKN